MFGKLKNEKRNRSVNKIVKNRDFSSTIKLFLTPGTTTVQSKARTAKTRQITQIITN